MHLLITNRFDKFKFIPKMLKMCCQFIVTYLLLRAAVGDRPQDPAGGLPIRSPNLLLRLVWSAEKC